MVWTSLALFGSLYIYHQLVPHQGATKADDSCPQNV